MEKTTDNLCHAYAVSKKHAYRDMVFVKQLFRKLEGRQYLHWVLSHDTGVSLEIVDKVAVEVMKLIGKEYQLIVGTHTNTNNLHTHFLINSVSYISGKKFSESRNAMLAFRKKINDILVCYGLNECGKVATVSEEEMNKEESLQRMQIKALKEDNLTNFTFLQTEDNVVFRGDGILDQGNLYMPGFLQEVKPSEDSLIPGMVYDEERTNVMIHNDDGIFVGQGKWEAGKFYNPGMLYRVDKEV